MAVTAVRLLALLGLFLVPGLLAWNPGCISKPVGFGHRATGGQGGKTVKPATPAELKKLLNSPGKLIIDLTKTYDFTKAEGYQTTQGCWYSACQGAGQKSLPLYGSCNGKKQMKVTYSVAGSRTLELKISSDKTVMSSNGKGEIVGKGVTILKAKNVILRDFTIRDINPDTIWGGDAIVLNGVQDVWIHHLTVRNVGRQHLVTYTVENKGVTVSSCLFDGNTKHGVYCDGKHYWMWLFWGTHDEITLINNRVVNGAGRTPHCGGRQKKDIIRVHMIGNEMDTNPHLGMEARDGSLLLAEGNTFINYKNILNPKASGGGLALINTPQQASQCTRVFKQACLANVLKGTPSPSRLDANVLNAFGKLDVAAINAARSAASQCAKRSGR